MKLRHSFVKPDHHSHNTRPHKPTHPTADRAAPQSPSLNVVYPACPFLGGAVVTVAEALFSPFALAVSFMLPAVVVVGRTIATATPCHVVRLPWWKELTSVGSPVPTAVSSPSPVTAAPAFHTQYETRTQQDQQVNKTGG